MIDEKMKTIAAATILNKTLKSSFFSICAVRDAAQILGRNPNSEEFELLNGLHCVHYSEMPRELRVKIPELVASCLGIEMESNPFQPVKIDMKMLAMNEAGTPANRFLSWLGLAK